MMKKISIVALIIGGIIFNSEIKALDNESIEKYVTMKEKIEYKDANIEKFISNEFNISDIKKIKKENNLMSDKKVKEFIKKIYTQQFDYFNEEIRKGNLILLPDGQLIDKTSLIRGGKSTGTIYYFWGTRKYYSTASAKIKIKSLRKRVKKDNKNQLIRDFLGITSIPAGAANLSISYVISNTKGLANAMERKNNNKGLKIDANWICNYKVFKQK